MVQKPLENMFLVMKLGSCLNKLIDREKKKDGRELQISILAHSSTQQQPM